MRNMEGCAATAKLGPFEVRAPDLFIPNVFSPNGDGINDGFLVLYEGDQPFYVEIRDRWGKLAFQTNNKQAAWNGLHSNGGKMPDGVYFYLVKIGAKEYVGEVTLVR